MQGATTQPSQTRRTSPVCLPGYLPAFRMTAEHPTSVSPTASRPSLSALPPGAISSINTSAGGPGRSARTRPSGFRSVSRMVCAAGTGGDAAAGALRRGRPREEGWKGAGGRPQHTTTKWAPEVQ